MIESGKSCNISLNFSTFLEKEGSREDFRESAHARATSVGLLGVFRYSKQKRPQKNR
jgi:hypothetical protein